jgi:hypothetical protein
VAGSSNANASGGLELSRKCPGDQPYEDGVFHRACSSRVDRDWTESVTTPDAAEPFPEYVRLRQEYVAALKYWGQVIASKNTELAVQPQKPPNQSRLSQRTFRPYFRVHPFPTRLYRRHTS